MPAPKQSARSEKAAERLNMALSLRKQGYSYERIGIILGEHFRGEKFHMVYASKLVHQAIKEIYKEKATEVIQLELARLDDMQLEVMDVLSTEHVTIANGTIMREIVKDPKTGLPEIDPATGLPKTMIIRDDGPRLAAIDRLLRIQERRARLLGLDKPTKVAGTTPDGTKSAPTVVMVSETDAKL